MKSLLTTVTPEYAQMVLDTKNTNNRNLNEKIVSMFAREMTEGRWGATHQGIAFYKDGSLADGQHRLAAIALSGCTVNIMVTHGVERESSMYMDTGRARSIGDVIKLSGQADWIDNQIIQTVRLVYSIDKVSADEIVLLAESVKNSLIFTHEIISKKTKGTTAPFRAAITLAHYHGESELRLMEFAEMFYSGIIKTESDLAVIKLRDFLMLSESRPKGYSGRMIDFSKSQSAIMKFCKHEPIKMLRALSELPYPRLNADKIISKNKE